MEINTGRSLALNFLLQLRTLCVKELSKGDDNLQEADSEDVLSVPANCKTSFCNKTHQDVNRPVISDNSDCVSSFPGKKVKQIPPKAKKSENFDAKTYRCSKCDYLTECHSEYINHVVDCTQTKYVGCPLCSQTCNASDLDDHIRSVHLTPDFFVRGNNGSYNCIKCNFTAKHFSKFKKHLVTNIHRGLDICHICKITISLEEMGVHQKKFHGKIGDAYVCKICGFSYSTKGGLDRHVSSTHSRKQMFKCAECGMNFTRQDNLARHVLTHSAVREHECHFCNRLFKSKTTLTEHIRNIHSKNRYQCQVCYRGFSNEIDRDNHVLTHEGFTFRCMVCGKGFKTHARRETHFQSHLNASKKTKAFKLALEKNSHHIKLNKSDPNVNFEKNYPSSSVSKRKAGDVLFPSNGQKPVKRDDNAEYNTGIYDFKENLKDTQDPSSVSKKRKTSVKGNSENKYPKLDGINKRRHHKTVVSEVSSFETVMKCDNSNNFDNDSNLESYHPNVSKSFDDQIGTDDEFIYGRRTAKSEKVDNLPKKYFNNCVLVDNEQVIKIPSIRKESEGYWPYPSDVSNSEKEISHFGSPIVLEPCSSIPEKTVFLDLNNIPVIDGNFESFSSLLPNSSVAESTLFIDADSLCGVQDIDIKDFNVADVYPVEVEYYEVQTENLDADNLLHHANLETDSKASICSAEDVLALPIKAERDCAVSLCNNVIEDKPLKRSPANKKTSVRQKSRKAPKRSKYPQTEKKVIIKNLCTDDDIFALPEFVIEEDEE